MLSASMESGAFDACEWVGPGWQLGRAGDKQTAWQSRMPSPALAAPSPQHLALPASNMLPLRCLRPLPTQSGTHVGSERMRLCSSGPARLASTSSSGDLPAHRFDSEGLADR